MGKVKTKEEKLVLRQAEFIRQQNKLTDLLREKNLLHTKLFLIRNDIQTVEIDITGNIADLDLLKEFREKIKSLYNEESEIQRRLNEIEEQLIVSSDEFEIIKSERLKELFGNELLQKIQKKIPQNIDKTKAPFDRSKSQFVYETIKLYLDQHPDRMNGTLKPFVFIRFQKYRFNYQWSADQCYDFVKKELSKLQ